MHRQRIELILVNLLCGGAVLFSYAHGIITHPSAGGALWGDVPRWLMPIYTGSMLSAAAGYLLFTFFLLFRVNPDEAMIARRYPYRLFPVLYGAVLVPSALWMPLTLWMITEPSFPLWIAIRIILAAVGIGSIGICAALILLRPRRDSWTFRLAVAGAIAFSIQTAILDALVWTAYFPVGRM